MMSMIFMNIVHNLDFYELGYNKKKLIMINNIRTCYNKYRVEK